MTTTASDRRNDAIGNVLNKYRTEANGYQLTANTRDIVEDIMALEKLGRTDRWKRAIRNWADAVEDGDRDDMASLDLGQKLHSDGRRGWAFVQFGIWANYAA